MSNHITIHSLYNWFNATISDIIACLNITQSQCKDATNKSIFRANPKTMPGGAKKHDTPIGSGIHPHPLPFTILGYFPMSNWVICKLFTLYYDN